MQEELELYLEEANDQMDEAVNHLHKELAKIRAGKASPAILNGILVEYYGSPTPLAQVANVGASDSKTITVQPWEKSMIAPIEQAIFAANIGVTPQNNGEIIIINIPPLTEERRKEYVKRAKAYGEDAKVSLRNSRHKILDVIKKAVKDGYPEDSGKRLEDQVQKMVNTHAGEITKIVEAKEKDILTI